MSKHVVIIGGGFAGINLARKLCKSSAFEITLVDKNNYNFFPPLLYQVSSSSSFLKSCILFHLGIYLEISKISDLEWGLF